MSRLQKIRLPHVAKWVSLVCPERSFASSKSNHFINGSYHIDIVQNVRLYGTEISSVDLRNVGDFVGKGRKGRAVREQAQAALAEYFHLTRSFRIMDAENMSKNAPEFICRLMNRVELDDGKVKRSVSRFLRYHPVNEFEPFFESIGLKPTEYVQFLPRDLMFLADDELLLENYYVLCNYGVERNRIGRIFLQVNEVFRYDYGVLLPKLRSFEKLGLKQSFVAKIVASTPHLLRGNAGEFVEFLEMLKNVGMDYDWLCEHICEDDSYSWKCMIRLMCFLCKSGWSEKQVGELFKQHPVLLLECSGRITFGLIGLMLKFGLTLSGVQSLFLQFPQIPVLKFVCNFYNSYSFLVGSDMDVLDIGQIVCSYPVLLGSLELKKVKSVLSLLNCGKERLRQMVKDDPFTLEGLVLGTKVEQLEKKAVQAISLRTQFLVSLGVKENSKDMEKFVKTIRGKGDELQQRFDCLVNNGISREQAIKMVKLTPQILNQTSALLETKIQFFLKDLGYQVSDLLAHPKILSYKTQRLKLRLLMYKWLKDQQAVRPDLALSTLLGTSDEEFIGTYVTPHAGGHECWNGLMKKHKPTVNK